jgi:hypothetical protein
MKPLFQCVIRVIHTVASLCHGKKPKPKKRSDNFIVLFRLCQSAIMLINQPLHSWKYVEIWRNRETPFIWRLYTFLSLFCCWLGFDWFAEHYIKCMKILRITKFQGNGKCAQSDDGKTSTFLIFRCWCGREREKGISILGIRCLAPITDGTGLTLVYRYTVICIV